MFTQKNEIPISYMRFLISTFYHFLKSFRNYELDFSSGSGYFSLAHPPFFVPLA